MYYQVRIQYRTREASYDHAEFVPSQDMALEEKRVKSFILSALPEGANIVSVKLLWSKVGPVEVVIRNINQAAHCAEKIPFRL